MEFVQVWHIWFSIAVTLLVLEIFNPFLVYAVFSLSCFLVSLLVALLDIGIYLQVGLFIILSVLIFVGIRPFFLKYVIDSRDKVKTNFQALVNQTGLVIETISANEDKGRIKLENGEDWKARSFDGSILEAGKRVVVLEVDSNILIVKTK